MGRRKTFDFGETAEGRAFTLPNEVCTETTAVYGRRGSGKSNSVTVILEGLSENGYQWVLFDPKGEGWGLRRQGEGGREGIPAVTFGEPQGDLPLREEHGQMIADFVVDSGRSCVLSLAGFESDQSERRFVTAFAERLYRRKMDPKHRTPLLVAIEEAHLFIPQSVGREENLQLRAIRKLVRQGRSFGIGVIIADQRPASVHNDIRTQMEILICHQTSAPHDRKALKEWITAHDVEDQASTFMDSVAALKPGEAWVWSPARLDVFARVDVRRRWTYDSGATPTQMAARPPGEAAEVDLEELREQLAAAVEEAEANDPMKLQQRITGLERELRQLREKPAIDQGAIDAAVAAVRAGFVDRETELTGKITELVSSHNDVVRAVRTARDQLTAMTLTEIWVEDQFTKATSNGKQQGGGVRDVARSNRTSQRDRVQPAGRRSHPEDPGGKRTDDPGSRSRAGEANHGGRGSNDSRVDIAKIEGRASLSGPERRVLDAIGWWRSIGEDDPGRARIAMIAGYHRRTKGFLNACGTLRTAGLMEGDQATAEGLALAEIPDDVPTLEDLHRRLRLQLQGRQRDIFDVLIEKDGRVSRDQIAEELDMHPRTKSVLNALGRLRSLGLIDYAGGDVVATDVMFPETLT